MKKLLSIVVVGAFVFAACGGSSGAVAATVNDAEISVGDVEGLIDIEESTIPIDQFAQFLGYEIQWEIVTQATADEWEIEITEGQIDDEADRIYEEADTGETREDFVSSRGVTEQFLREIAEQNLIDEAVRAELADDVADPTDEEIQAEMEDAAASLTEVCVSHILVSTQEEAQAVMDRLEGGEDFGDLATELSQDPGSAENAGVLPCTNAGQYVAEFRDAALSAPVGEVNPEIVETQFGFHVLEVTDRQETAVGDLPTRDEVIDSLRSDAVALELNSWFLDTVSAADVTVDEQYGTWQPTPQPSVIPPSE